MEGSVGQTWTQEEGTLLLVVQPPGIMNFTGLTLSVWNRLCPSFPLQALWSHIKQPNAGRIQLLSLLFSLITRKENLFQRPSHPRSSLKLNNQKLVTWPAMFFPWKGKWDCHEWLRPITLQLWGQGKNLPSWAYCCPGITEQNPCSGWVRYAMVA